MGRAVFAWSWHTSALAALSALFGLAVSIPMLLDGSVNRLGKIVAVLLLAFTTVVAAAFGRARVVLTERAVVSHYGLRRRTYPYEKIASAEVVTGSSLTTMRCPSLSMWDGSTVVLGHVANGRRRKLADDLASAVRDRLHRRRPSA